MSHPIMFDDADPMLAQVRDLTLAFPGAAEKISHGRPAFYTQKVFAYFGGSVKVDGGYVAHDQAVMVKADPVEAPALVEEPDCFVPAYLGPSGWLGFDLHEHTDWGWITDLVEASYRLTAGKRLVAELDAQQR